MHSTPDVSVIIPIYKVEKYIERNVRSLMEQTLDNMEFIFVDDCSPDNSVSILMKTLEDYPSRKKQVKIIHHEKNMGLPSARVTGFLNSTGRYIAHCDSDDWVDTNMYKTMLETAKKYDADVVSCDFTMAFPYHTEICTGNHWEADKKRNLQLYISSLWTVLWNLLISRKVYDKLIENDQLALDRTPNLKISYCEDFHLGLRLLYFANKIVNVNTPLYYYNQMNVSSIMHNLDNVAMNQRLTAHLDIINWLKQQNDFKDYEKELSWRVLYCKQELIWDKSTHNEFLNIFPDCHKFILSSPFINSTKAKFMMWTLTHHLSIIPKVILTLTSLKHRYLQSKRPK